MLRKLLVSIGGLYSQISAKVWLNRAKERTKRYGYYYSNYFKLVPTHFRIAKGYFQMDNSLNWLYPNYVFDSEATPPFASIKRTSSFSVLASFSFGISSWLDTIVR